MLQAACLGDIASLGLTHTPPLTLSLPLFPIPLPSSLSILSLLYTVPFTPTPPLENGESILQGGYGYGTAVQQLTDLSILPWLSFPIVHSGDWLHIHCELKVKRQEQRDHPRLFGSIESDHLLSPPFLRLTQQGKERCRVVKS